MAIVTMEDLQGTIEVVVFPRLYEQTGPTWREGEILLVAGRVDHKGEEISLLADLVVDWDDAVGGRRRTPSRGRSPRATAAAATARPGGERIGYGQRPRRTGARPRRRRAAGRSSPVGPGPGPAPVAGDAARPAAPADRRPAGGPVRLAATRGGAAPRRRRPRLPPIAPAEPISTARRPAAASAVGPDQDDEPAGARRGPRADRGRRDRRRRRSTPGRSTVLHVRFAGERRRAIGWSARWRRSSPSCATGPGETRVVIHVPAPGGGAALPMELRRGVAYDAELLAEVRRRLGDGLVELHLACA